MHFVAIDKKNNEIRKNKRENSKRRARAYKGSVYIPTSTGKDNVKCFTFGDYRL